MRELTLDEGYEPEPRARFNFKPIRYVVNNETSCWECTSHHATKGYPKITRFGKHVKLSRYVFELFNKRKIKDDLHILHSCDNRHCINPDHLSEGTNDQNIAEKLERGRQKRGKDVRSPIPDEKVLEIRRLTKEGTLTNAQIAKAYGVSEDKVSVIKHNKRWKNLTV